MTAEADRSPAVQRLKALLKELLGVEGDCSRGYEVWLRWRGDPLSLAGARRFTMAQAAVDLRSLINGLTVALLEAGVTVSEGPPLGAALLPLAYEQACSFCRRPRTEVGKLVGTDTAAICLECADLARDIMAEPVLGAAAGSAGEPGEKS